MRKRRERKEKMGEGRQLSFSTSLSDREESNICFYQVFSGSLLLAVYHCNCSKYR